MKRRILSMNCRDKYADGMAAQFSKEYNRNGLLADRIVRIVGVVVTICGAGAFFVAGSFGAMAESGIASVYAYSGSKTASGERANPGGLTAAHRTLKFGTRVRVTNQRNGRSIIVRINDRGPFVRGRVIDITPAGARALGFSGLAPVKIELAQN